MTEQRSTLEEYIKYTLMLCPEDGSISEHLANAMKFEADEVLMLLLRAKFEAKTAEIVDAAIQVVEARYDNAEWYRLSDLIGELADALHKAGHGHDWDWYEG